MKKIIMKIEFDLPEFEKTINISITLTRDGVVSTTTSPPVGVNINIPEASSSPKKEKKSASGNMMDCNF